MRLTSVVTLVLFTLVRGDTRTNLPISYEGYKVYKVIAKTETENEFLQHLQLNSEYDFWSKINKVGKPVSVMASPIVQQEFEAYLTTHKINHTVEIENVEATILAEKQYHQSKQAIKSTNSRGVTFDQYVRHSDINAYLDLLADTYPDIVTVSTIGRSYENRTMKLIRISSSSGPSSKPVLFIEGGMHAREWISPALALYIINQLVENPQNRGLIENLDWIVLPVMNPDGYEYTWNTNRMWRKTRSLGLICDGVDGNRNFGFYWMEAGASSQECSETYAGREAFSEVEARNLREVLDATDNIAAFVSIHSYGQYLFYPYSYANVVPVNWRELRDLATRVNNVISAIDGTTYTVGSSTEVLYPAAGCSDDWAMGGAGIEIVLTFELPGGGQNGFDLPPTRILPVVTETWEGIKVIAEYVEQNAKQNY